MTALGSYETDPQNTAGIIADEPRERGGKCDLIVDGTRMSLADLYAEPAKPKLTLEEELACDGWTLDEFYFGRDVARAEAASTEPMHEYTFEDRHPDGDSWETIRARTEAMAFAKLRNMREPKLIGVKAR